MINAIIFCTITSFTIITFTAISSMSNANHTIKDIDVHNLTEKEISYGFIQFKTEIQRHSICEMSPECETYFLQKHYNRHNRNACHDENEIVYYYQNDISYEFSQKEIKQK
eukprot:478827_1